MKGYLFNFEGFLCAGRNYKRNCDTYDDVDINYSLLIVEQLWDASSAIIHYVNNSMKLFLEIFGVNYDAALFSFCKEYKYAVEILE